MRPIALLIVAALSIQGCRSSEEVAEPEWDPATYQFNQAPPATAPDNGSQQTSDPLERVPQRARISFEDMVFYTLTANRKLAEAHATLLFTEASSLDLDLLITANHDRFMSARKRSRGLSEELGESYELLLRSASQSRP